MTKPIGRIWLNDECISGYIVTCGNVCIKFAASTNSDVNWIYPSKVVEESEDEQEARLQEEVEAVVLQ